MSLSVPYHPYNSCLICGDSHAKSVKPKKQYVVEEDSQGQEWVVEWWPYEGPLASSSREDLLETKNKRQKKLLKCSACKQALYCSLNCQKHDWNVHRRECFLLQEENKLAVALAETDQENFASAVDGRSLRKLLSNSSQTSPLIFVLSELNLNLKASMKHWDPANVANGMATNRMNTLLDTVFKVAFLTNGKGERRGIPWLELSSLLFGTCMVHRVVNGQASEGFKFGENAWFESFLYNFGEVCDRIKLYALLQDNGYAHFLPDHEFPLLKMKEPSLVNGKYYFPETRIKVPFGKRCMTCGKILKAGPAISSHDPDRNGDRLLPRQTNFLPPRPPQMTSLTADPKLREKAELKMKTWLHIVARTKTIPKEFVCGEECEQHSIYGRLFDGHPLNHVKSESPLHSTIAD